MIPLLSHNVKEYEYDLTPAGIKKTYLPNKMISPLSYDVKEYEYDLTPAGIKKMNLPKWFHLSLMMWRNMSMT